MTQKDQVAAVQELTTAQARHPDIKTISDANRAAYASVASEYDDPTHRTTRALESATIAAWQRGVMRVDAEGPILEVGSGTGVLTAYLAHHPHLQATDLTPEMLDVAAQKLPTVHFSQLDVFSPCCQPVKTVVAGLADPYLIAPALLALRQLLRRTGTLFVTVPEASWAEQERTARLYVPANMTRFRLRDGTHVMPFSFAYTTAELRELLYASGLTPIEVWEEIADVHTTAEPLSPAQQKVVRVACALARHE